jgi:hypothetical protein
MSGAAAAPACSAAPVTADPACAGSNPTPAICETVRWLRKRSSAGCFFFTRMADRAKPAAAASPTASESPVAGGRGQRRKGPDRAAQPRYRAVCWLIGGSGPIEPCHQILQGAVAAAVAGGAAGLLAGMDLVGPDLDDETVRIAGHLAGSCPAQSYPSVRLDRPKCRSSPTRNQAVSALNRLETWPRSVTGPGTPHGSAARSGHWCRRGAARSHQSMVSASAVMRSRRPAMNSA